jgi:hypothetical protein
MKDYRGLDIVGTCSCCAGPVIFNFLTNDLKCYECGAIAEAENRFGAIIKMKPLSIKEEGNRGNS